MRFFSRFRGLVSYRSGYRNNGVLHLVPGAFFGPVLLRKEGPWSTLRRSGIDAFSFRVCLCNLRVRDRGKVNKGGEAAQAGGLRRLRRSFFFLLPLRGLTRRLAERGGSEALRGES